jgi:hypothetical protein
MIDLLIKNQLIVELKCVDKIHPIHEAQILTYMKLSKDLFYNHHFLFVLFVCFVVMNILVVAALYYKLVTFRFFSKVLFAVSER